MNNRPGYTLLELTLVVSLATLLVGIAVPSMLRGLHALAVRGAHAELTATVAATRTAAIMAGGANVVIDLDAAAVWIETAAGERVGDTRDLDRSYGVALESSRGPVLTLRFDALGIGRLANATIRIRRGRAVSSIVVSAYGRVRS